MSSLGDPERFGQVLDELVLDVRPAVLAEIEQAVHHWRGAGWPDLAIGALVAMSGYEKSYRDLYTVQALRRVV
ncbi:hypothetical protein UFOVP314_22 [uncultured Caudovirales phage]|uniref:Uncharacterized protein n=1 Tax=uncultured Caudovirales phage TaxID=2100421 RepID=A0A6J5LUW9_9CAUD|nr:hypothetical protein UFOVP314_22 [uncultured Caudovirales phage]